MPPHTNHFRSGNPPLARPGSTFVGLDSGLVGFCVFVLFFHSSTWFWAVQQHELIIYHCCSILPATKVILGNLKNSHFPALLRAWAIFAGYATFLRCQVLCIQKLLSTSGVKCMDECTAKTRRGNIFYAFDNHCTVSFVTSSRHHLLYVRYCTICIPVPITWPKTLFWLATAVILIWSGDKSCKQSSNMSASMTGREERVTRS